MPADDLTDPGPRHHPSPHLDATHGCSAVTLPPRASTLRWTRWIPPAASSTRMCWAAVTYDAARAVQQVLQRYRELQDIIAIMGMG